MLLARADNHKICDSLRTDQQPIKYPRRKDELVSEEKEIIAQVIWSGSTFIYAGEGLLRDMLLCIKALLHIYTFEMGKEAQPKWAAFDKTLTEKDSNAQRPRTCLDKLN